MIRQTLDGTSPAVDVAVHGSGLTSLQFRDAAGVDTREVESNVSAPGAVRIEKRGDFIYAFVSGKDGKLQPAGASTKLALTGEFYVGIGVCAHNKDVVEKAVFSNVSLEQLPPATASRPSSALSKPSPSPPPIAMSNMSPPPTLKLPTGLATANPSSSTRREPSAALRSMAASPRRSPPLPKSIATTITASRPTAGFSPSATPRPKTISPAFTFCPSPEAHPARSRPMLRRTGMAGRPTARPLLSPASAAATSTSTPFPSPAEKKRASPPPPASTTAPSILLTAPISTSTPSAPGKCRFGA